MKLFTEIGLPKIIPVIVGYQNLTLEQQDHAQSQGWDIDSFPDHEIELFWYLDNILYCLEHDCKSVDSFNVLYGSGFTYYFGYSQTFAISFNRDNYHHVVDAVVQRVQPTCFQIGSRLQKLYTIDVTRHDKKTGEIYARYDLGLVPMTHKEACTLISKQTNYVGRSFILVEFPRTDGLTPDLA